ncbi:hypothetical protein NDU88_001069 [Pleurodeles waltl]|uniref:Uncharacterized protein n=1 Tax=Pleurodeles waltl TaxID=8319 RepID=A0AAV7Q2L4_PLEWA|nr:hypothetical protein NDU88_001069 [Pleurodeles waltl]
MIGSLPPVLQWGQDQPQIRPPQGASLLLLPQKGPNDPPVRSDRRWDCPEALHQAPSPARPKKAQSKSRAQSRSPAKQKGPNLSHNFRAAAPDKILEGQAGLRAVQPTGTKCGKVPLPRSHRSAKAKYREGTRLQGRGPK